MKKFAYFLTILAVLTLGMYACQIKEPVVNHTVYNKTVMDVLRSDARFSTLVRAIERTNLTPFFDTPLNRDAGEGEPGDSITILAPNNAAFARANIDVNTINENTLRQILLYHVPLVGRSLLQGVTTAPAIPPLPETNVLRNGLLPGFTTPNTDNFLRMRNARLRQENIPTPSVPNPPAPNPTTVLSNTDRAYIQGTRINEANILTPNIICSNGVIHEIDRVMSIPSQTLWDIISTNSNYSLFARAVERVGLRPSLENQDAIRTILVPTNAAFNAAGFPDIASIDNANLTSLSNTIRYHVTAPGVGNRRFTINNATLGLPNNFTLFTDLGSAINQQVIIVYSGNDMVFNLNNNWRMVGGVSRTGNVDRHAINGVVHEINAVLAPYTTQVLTAEQILQNNSNTTLFRQAIDASGLSALGNLSNLNFPNTAPANSPTIGGSYTIFAPNNAAMEAAGYSAARLNTILNAGPNSPDKVALRELVRYHIVTTSTTGNSSARFSTMFTNGNQNTMLWNGVPFLPATGPINTSNSPTRQNFRQVVISVSGGVFAIRGTGDADFRPVLPAPDRDIYGTNGVVHVIDRVLKP
ncbi:MAG: fasciclin domain-containing protein [Microscillaceae bacterium]|nr:fasciclin domain-containing protein [Microscillaceae bacterium]MDW8459950.1 fasciclin domain-containing protein [Cytophagales bacterium]